jgi:FkbM family methyltransferase
MRILWHSVAPWVPTGYGQQTGIMTPRIKALGHDVALSVYYGLQGAQMDWQGMTCYPSYAANYGSDVIVPHALAHFGVNGARSVAEAVSGGIIITLGDVWTFEVPFLNQMCVASWVPVDHLAVPAMTRGWFRVSGAVPIAMSRFGQRALADAGYQPLYVPHGIDTEVFCPGDRAAARERAGLPADAFIVGMVANNIGKDGNRKAFAEQIRAFARLRARHGDAMMALHTDVDNPVGMDLRSFLDRELPEGSYTFTPPYQYRKGMKAEAIADIHRSADVLSNCSYGEGFGIPIVEAQACGTPVIVTAATAMPELCGAGWTVPYEETWHESQVGWIAKPLISGIAEAYEQAYEKARDDQMRLQAVMFARDYDADTVVEQWWRPALARLEGALAGLADSAAAARPAPRPQVREADGLLWTDRGRGTGDRLGWADHEQELRIIVEDLLPAGGIVLDVGAHVGHWSLRLAGKASHVVAVEANPETVKVLRRNIAVNGIENVAVLQMAAWDEAAQLRLSDPAGQSAGGSTRVLPDETGTVWGEPLDAQPELAQLPRLDLVKLDVEGADLHALRGMAGLLGKFRPALFIECHDVYGYYRREDLEALLTSLGYEWEIAASVMTAWMPDGGDGTLRRADWLACRPGKVDLCPR